MFMLAKKLRAAVAAFVVAALLPVSAATAMPTGGQRQSLDSSFLSAVESLGSSLWRMCCEVLAKAGVRSDQNGNH
jgi:type IV secretory pathway VirB2 component (pilin)